MSRIRVALAVCIPIVAICGLQSSQFSLQMVEKLNHRLLRDQQFDPIGWHAGKYSRFNTVYRAAFGRDRLWRWRRAVMVGGFAALAVAVGLLFS
jgi:hypothetical protein